MLRFEVLFLLPAGLRLVRAGGTSAVSDGTVSADAFLSLSVVAIMLPESNSLMEAGAFFSYF